MLRLLARTAQTYTYSDNGSYYYSLHGSSNASRDNVMLINNNCVSLEAVGATFIDEFYRSANETACAGPKQVKLQGSACDSSLN